MQKVQQCKGRKRYGSEIANKNVAEFLESSWNPKFLLAVEDQQHLLSYCLLDLDVF